MLFQTRALATTTLLAALLHTTSGDVNFRCSATVPHVDPGFVKDRHDLSVPWQLPGQKPSRPRESCRKERDCRRGPQFHAHRNEEGSELIAQSLLETRNFDGETPFQIAEIEMAEPGLNKVRRKTSELVSGTDYEANNFDAKLKEEEMEQPTLTQPVNGIVERRLEKDRAESDDSPNTVPAPAKARRSRSSHSNGTNFTANLSTAGALRSPDNAITQIPAFAEPDRFTIPSSSQTATSSASRDSRTSSILKRAIGNFGGHAAFPPSTPPPTITSAAPPLAAGDQHWYSSPWVGCASWLFFLYSLASFIMLSWLWAKGWIDCTGRWLRPIPMREREGSLWVNDSGRVERDGWVGVVV